MSWPDEVVSSIRQLDAIKRDLNHVFVARERAIDLLALAAVTHEHLLLIGPPGTAKTAVIHRFCDLVEARGFTYLISRFTEPAELFGPLDLQKFQAGTYEIRTEGMLPAADIAFLDEVFQGSSPILNSLLSIINERFFHNGANRQPVPLATLIGASNSLPDDPWLQAFADRFLLRLEVGPVDDGQIDDLLDFGWQLESDKIRQFGAGPDAVPRVAPRMTMQEIARLHSRLVEMDLTPIRKQFAQILKEMRADNVVLSDRRVTKCLKLLGGSALLRNRESAGAEDLWVLEHVWNRPEEQETMRRIIRRHMREAGVETPNLAPPIDEIDLRIETLEREEDGLKSEASIQAHLTELNLLRRQVMQYHPRNHDVRRKIEAAVERVMEQLVTR